MRVIFDLWFFALVVVFTLLALALTAWLAYRYGARKGEIWRATLDTLPLGVVLLDAAGRQTFANSAARELLPRFDGPALAQIRAAAAPVH